MRLSGICISAACSLFISRNGMITCVVTGHLQYSVDLPQGGLDVPCHLIFSGKNEDIIKMKKLLIREPEPKELEPSCKRRNISADLTCDRSVSDKSRSLWLIKDNIELFSEDKDTIMSGDWLSDKHINFAQNLLKNQYQNSVSGLMSTLLLHRSIITSPRAIQIIHCRENHWIVATTIGCSSGEVKVFDSLYTSVDEATSALITNPFNGATQIVVLRGPKQIGTKDCGLYAIATATTLASSCDINCACNVVYDQSLMRGHLLEYFENYYLSPL